MKVTLDEYGIPLSDVAVQEFVNERLASKSDIHVSSALVIDALRASLLKLPVESRPQITWTFYGKEVHFDQDLRSEDAWNDPRICISGDILEKLLSIYK